jgi:hypothetical protein
MNPDSSLVRMNIEMSTPDLNGAGSAMSTKAMLFVVFS